MKTYFALTKIILVLAVSWFTKKILFKTLYTIFPVSNEKASDKTSYERYEQINTSKLNFHIFKASIT